VQLGLTQEDLAARASELGDDPIRQSDISRIERGTVRMPRLSRLETLATALETDLGSLLVSAGWLSPVRASPDNRPPE
jgi:transcriptional regulator with XRE-family HTH domain